MHRASRQATLEMTVIIARLKVPGAPRGGEEENERRLMIKFLSLYLYKDNRRKDFLPQQRHTNTKREHRD